MRSDLVFSALSRVPNRYELCQLASKATRKLHRPNSRVEETMDAVLTQLGGDCSKPSTAPVGLPERPLVLKSLVFRGRYSRRSPV
jgi:hypothetical protein